MKIRKLLRFNVVIGAPGKVTIFTANCAVISVSSCQTLITQAIQSGTQSKFTADQVLSTSSRNTCSSIADQLDYQPSPTTSHPRWAYWWIILRVHTARSEWTTRPSQFYRPYISWNCMQRRYNFPGIESSPNVCTPTHLQPHHPE